MAIHLRRRSILLMLFEIDADGKGPDAGHIPARMYRALLIIHARFDATVYGVEEVRAMVVQVKCQKVVAEHAIQQLFLPGKDSKGLSIGPRDVPELRHDQIGIALLSAFAATERSDNPG